MSTLNISLPQTDLEFLQQYAQQQNLTVSEVITQWVRCLQVREKPSLHPQLATITGILPTNLNVRDDYYQHILRKHQ
ncbi:MAG: hypothetical protein HC877_20265 [Thioploca sp.]|nr:hypothetical protein [Thioploca sp.]